jgi:hypothetical protein
MIVAVQVTGSLCNKKIMCPKVRSVWLAKDFTTIQLGKFDLFGLVSNFLPHFWHAAFYYMDAPPGT